MVLTFWTCDVSHSGPIESLPLVSQLVSQLVCYQFFSKTVLRIFLIFCMNVQYHKGKKRTRRFFRKNFGSFKNHENVLFFKVFRDYLENATNDFSRFCSECSPEQYLSACENRLSKKNSFSRYSSLKVRFGPKNAKMGSKESQISRERQMLSKI